MKTFLKTVKIQVFGFLKASVFPIGMYLLLMVISLSMGKTSYVSSLAFDYIFRTSVTTTLMALAIAIPLAGGRWDFATGTVAILSGIIGGNLASYWHLNVAGLLFLTLAVSIVLEIAEQWVYTLLKISETIVSLGFVMAYEALTGLLFNGEGSNIVATSRDLVVLNSAPWCYLLLAVALVTLFVLLEETKYGYDCRSLSENPALAVDSGVKDKANILWTAVLVGALLGIVGVLTISKGVVTPQSNLSSTSLMFSAMGPVLIGLFLSRFVYLPFAVFLAGVGMNALSYGMVVQGLSSSIQQIILGVFIVLFMAFTANATIFQRVWKNFLRDLRRLPSKKV